MKLTMHKHRIETQLVIALAIVATSGTAHAQDVPDISQLAGVVRWSGVALSVLVIVGSIVTLRFVGGAAERLSLRFANRRPLIQKIESFTRFFIYFVTAGMVVVLAFRIDKSTLAVVGGALAFAVGFAMRDLVAAVIAGITIMFDRPFQVGDRVRYAGQYGDILQIGLRSVRMCTLNDDIVTIPNNKVLTDVTASGNYGALDMMVAMDFHIAVDQDVELAERLVLESFLTSRYVFLEKPVTTVIQQVFKHEYPALKVTGKGYVLDTRYEMAFVTDVNKRVLRAFRKHGIGAPAVLHRPEEPTPAPGATAQHDA